MKNVAAFASGKGSNIQALWRASQDVNSAFRLGVILADRSCGAIEFAKQKCIPWGIIPENDRIISRNSFDKIIENEYLKEIDFIAFAGFMKIARPAFLDDWQGKVVNIHPSLLPKYAGLNTHQRAIDAQDKSAGCSVHFVDYGIDTGELIAQASCPIEENDTSKTLAKRVLQMEHLLYPMCLNALCKTSLPTEKYWIYQTLKASVS